MDIERLTRQVGLDASPLYLFGNLSRLVYVNNPKACCTFAQNIVFYANHGYAYFDPIELHYSHFAFWRLGGTPPQANEAALERLQALDPIVFSFTRDPLRRLVSGFHSKLIVRTDKQFAQMRDDLTCRGGIDLSAGCDKRRSILAFCEWLHSHRDRPYWLDTHFRPQSYNLYLDGVPGAASLSIDTLIRIEDKAALDNFAMEHAPGLDRSVALYNESAGLNFPDYYSDDLAALARRVYDIDYELLGY